MMEAGWSVRSWLSSIGLSQYGETFESNGLTDPAVVATITESDLQAIGITMLGHKKKILMEAPKISQGSASGGGASPASGAPAHVKNLPNAWKLTWDLSHSNIVSIGGDLILNGDTKSMWAKQDGSSDVDGVTAGPMGVQLWNLRDVSCIRQIEMPSGHSDFRHTSFDVWESQKTVVCTLRNLYGDGFIIMLYDMTGQVKTLRTETAEPPLYSVHILPNASPAMMAAHQKDKVRLFDANSSRPLASWQSESDVRHIEHDPNQPNVFYAKERNRIVVYDRNVKHEVSVISGMQEMRDMKVPNLPGTQIVAMNGNECKVWDIRTGNQLHAVGGFNYGQSASLYANVLAFTENDKIRVYDLNDGVSEPAKELRLVNQGMRGIFVLPSKVVTMTNCSLWSTTQFEA